MVCSAHQDHFSGLGKKYFHRAVSSNGIFFPTIISNGRVIGAWKRLFKKESIVIQINPFSPLTNKEKKKLETAIENYGKFIKMRAVLGKH